MHPSNPKTDPPTAASVPSPSPSPSRFPDLLPPPFPVPPPHPYPELTDDDKERIETWFEHDSRLTEVASQLGIGVLTLAAWAKQPHIRDALNDIREIATFRTETLRAEAEHASVNRLLSLVRFSTHEEIARRAAANILGQGLRRGRGTGLPPGVFPSPSTTASPSSPPPRDPPQRRDDLTPSIPTPRVPTPPVPTPQSPSSTDGLGQVPRDQEQPNTDATSPTPPPSHFLFQTSNLKSPPPLLPHLRDNHSPSLTAPVPRPAPPDTS